MTTQIILIDGPTAGKTWTVRDVSDVFYVAIADSAGMSSMFDAWSMFDTTSVKKVIYRARRIASTGHICYDDQQRAIFEYRGER